MKKTLHLLQLVSISIVISCSGSSDVKTSTVRISDRYYSDGIIGIGEYVSSAENNRKKWRRFYYTRYLIVSDQKTVEGQILNRAVKYILESSYHEAGVLLNQIKGTFHVAVLNNRAVLNEINGNYDEARNYYHKALELDSGNKVVLYNLNSMRY